MSGEPCITKAATSIHVLHKRPRSTRHVHCYAATSRHTTSATAQATHHEGCREQQCATHTSTSRQQHRPQREQRSPCGKREHKQPEPSASPRLPHTATCYMCEHKRHERETCITTSATSSQVEAMRLEMRKMLYRLPAGDSNAASRQAQYASQLRFRPITQRCVHCETLPALQNALCCNHCRCCSWNEICASGLLHA